MDDLTPLEAATRTVHGMLSARGGLIGSTSLVILVIATARSVQLSKHPSQRGLT